MTNLQQIIAQNEKTLSETLKHSQFIDHSRIREILRSSQLRLIEGFREMVREAKEKILSGYCKCCGHNPCNQSTTGCEWKYSEGDKAVQIIDELISELNEIK